MLEKTGLTGAARWLDETSPASSPSTTCPERRWPCSPKGRVATGAGGVTSLQTLVEVDADTVFQVGYITKIWTTTLVMQLVDDGLLDLTQPLLDHLPELVIGDMDAAKALTTRHLLTHTAGFEGDVGQQPGNDALAKYVDSLAELPQLFAPGFTFSYNNTAFVVLGRLVEVLRGSPTTRSSSSGSRSRSVWRASARARTRRSCTVPPPATWRTRTAR